MESEFIFILDEPMKYSLRYVQFSILVYSFLKNKQGKSSYKNSELIILLVKAKTTMQMLSHNVINVELTQDNIK